MNKYYKWKVLGVFALIALVVGLAFKARYNEWVDHRDNARIPVAQQPAPARQPADKLATEADYYDAIVVHSDAYVIIIDGVETQYRELDNVKLYLDVYAAQLTGKRFNIISRGNQSLARITTVADLLKERNIQLGQILY